MTKMDLGWATLRCLCCGTDYGIVRILAWKSAHNVFRGAEESAQLRFKRMFEPGYKEHNLLPLIEWIGDIDGDD